MRRGLLAATAAAWWWANSVFAPWAESMAPRLWLYDTLYYLGFVLLAWGVAEVGLIVLRWRRTHVVPMRSLAWMCTMLAGVALSTLYARTESGLRFKVSASADALARSATLPYEMPRHRAGHFLVDTVREPVKGEPWLWIGQPFGGGTGTGRALVRSGARAPTPPGEGTYRYRRITDDWWMAELVR